MHDAIVVGGGQSGLAAARAPDRPGLKPLVLEAGAEPVGSWPGYYDSLPVFSPVEFSSMPGRRFPGEAEHYPHRDEVVDYLRGYANSLDVDIRTGTRVTSVAAGDGDFLVRTDTADVLQAAALVVASGSFRNPFRPIIPGQDEFTGRVLHVADYRSPKPHSGELVPTTHVMDTGGYRHALETGRFDLGFLESLGALRDGAPLHNGGLSATHRGLAYVGLEFQRSFASNTLRGVHRDADHVAAPLAALVRGAPAAVGL